MPPVAAGHGSWMMRGLMRRIKPQAPMGGKQPHGSRSEQVGPLPVADVDKVKRPKSNCEMG
jgi:hypothetical protein